MSCCIVQQGADILGVPLEGDVIRAGKVGICSQVLGQVEADPLKENLVNVV